MMEHREHRIGLHSSRLTRKNCVIGSVAQARLQRYPKGDWRECIMKRPSERPKGVSPASRVLGYTLAECPALDISGGAWIATFPQSTPQSSPSPPAQFAHLPRDMNPSESDTDSPRLSFS